MSNNKNALIEKGQKTLNTVIETLKSNEVTLDEEQKKAGRALLGSITTLLQDSGVAPDEVDGNSFRQSLEKAMLLKLNAAASPRECYVMLRATPLEKQGNKVVKWGKKIEFGVEGSGNDTLLAEFGIGVKEVGNVWKVKEGDIFEYPTYSGFEAKPPKWIPKGKGKLLKVVYPIKKESGAIEYHLAEREDAIYNLLAHISQNMMPDLKGGYKKEATLTEGKRKELLDKVKEAGVDATLDGAVPEVMKYISKAWTEPHSREFMLERKIRNNAIKKYPKNFKNVLAQKAFQEVSDETLNENLSEKEEKSNKGDYVDIDDFNINEDTGETLDEDNKDGDNEELNDKEQEIEIYLDEAYSIEVPKGNYQGKTLEEVKKINKAWITKTKQQAEEKGLTDTELYKAIKFIVENDEDFSNDKS